MSSIGARHVDIAPKGRERALRSVIVAGVVLYTAYVAAIVAGAPESFSNVVFAILMAPGPIVVWLTYAKAPPALSTLWLLFAIATSLWFIGTAVWYAYYLAAGGRVPDPPGPWDAIFTIARLTGIAAIVVAMRSIVSFRLAVLDAAVIGAVGIATGAVFVSRGLESDIDASSLVLLNSPLLGTLTLMLIVSAALGSTSGLPLSTALVGAGQGLLTIGSMIYSYQSVQDAYVDTRLADIPYTAGAVVSYFATAAILLRADRHILLVPARTPHRLPGSRHVVLLSLAALALSLAVAVLALLTDRPTLALVGVGTSGVTGLAMAFRARDAIRAAEHSSDQLDIALAGSERARNDLDLANADLQRANADLRTLQIAVAQGFNLIDERTQGRLREVVEEAGDDLAALVDETLDTDANS